MTLIAHRVELPGGALGIEQPAEAAELPDDGAVEWAPLVPYWSVLWRSGVALAHEVAGANLRGKRVIELGCGLGLPSLAAVRAGAEVLATDADPEALALLGRNAAANGLAVETRRFDWADEPPAGRFDLALAADVLYERPAVAQLRGLLPRLAPETWLADPGRPAADALLARLDATTSVRGVVKIHRLR